MFQMLCSDLRRALLRRALLALLATELGGDALAARATSSSLPVYAACEVERIRAVSYACPQPAAVTRALRRRQQPRPRRVPHAGHMDYG